MSSATPAQPKTTPKPPPPPPPSPSSPAQPTCQPIPTPTTVPALPIWQRLGPLTYGATAYARAQRRRPLLTQFLTSLLTYLVADVSAQRIGRTTTTDKDGNQVEGQHDVSRTVRSLIIGGVFSIPAYKWFVWLSHSFNYPSSKLLSLGTKVVVNQLCFTPVFNTYFFGMQALLAGETLAEAWDRVKRTVPVSFVNSWKLWPAVTAFNFTFVPVEYRSVFAGVVAVGWQTYLAYLNRRAEEYEARKRLGMVSAVELVEPVKTMVAA